MTVQLGTTLRNNMMNQYETTVGLAPKLRFITGAPPVNCAAAQTGTQLAELTLPSDWMSAAANGAIAKLGTWTGTGSVSGSVGYYRLNDSAGTTCHEQGTVTVTGGGGDMTVDNIAIAPAQIITVTAWDRTQSGA